MKTTTIKTKMGRNSPKPSNLVWYKTLKDTHANDNSRYKIIYVQ